MKSLFEAVSLVCSVMASLRFCTGIFTGTADWDRADGSKVPGSVEVTGSGTDAVYTLVGDGNDIWDAADEVSLYTRRRPDRGRFRVNYLGDLAQMCGLNLDRWLSRCGVTGSPTFSWQRGNLGAKIW